MKKIITLLLLSLTFLFLSPRNSEALNTRCSTKGVQIYTTDSQGNSVGPAKNTPYNIEVRYPQIKPNSSYRIELKLGNSGRAVEIFQVQATETGKISITNLQLKEDSLGPYLFTFSESGTEVCDSNTFTALATPLTEEQIKNLQSQQTSEGCKSGDANCTSGKGQTCTDGTKNGVKTAIGCVPTEPKELINGLLRTLTFASGGIAFLIMLLSSLQMITAEGNPQTIKGAQEKFYSAIIGLLLVIFSVLLMQVIGVDILGLPGFGPTK